MTSANKTAIVAMRRELRDAFDGLFDDDNVREVYGIAKQTNDGPAANSPQAHRALQLAEQRERVAAMVQLVADDPNLLADLEQEGTLSIVDLLDPPKYVGTIRNPADGQYSVREEQAYGSLTSMSQTVRVSCQI